MKIEVMAARAARNGLSLRDRLIAYLPHYAPLASRAGPLLNLRNRVPVLASVTERVAGFSARRKLPKWRRDFFARDGTVGSENGREVVLFADTFNRYFEPDNLNAALAVLAGAGYRVHLPKAQNGSARPLCCGRTFLTAGLVDQARIEAERTLSTLLPFVQRGVPVVGLEPSCLFTFRDELLSLAASPSARSSPVYGGGVQASGEAAKSDGGARSSKPTKSYFDKTTAQKLAANSFMFEEFLAREIDAGRFKPALAPIGNKAMLHGHCHQKAFDAVGPVTKVLSIIPGLKTEVIDSSCCGMAGAFGYQTETFDVSIAMAERSLLPAVRNAEQDTLIVADGTSCRHQIGDGSGRTAHHVAIVLARSMLAASARK
jgi:Fe-S oxidoreductase